MYTRRVKVRVEQSQVQTADVAVINVRQWPAWALAILYALFGMSLPLMAAILPEERADILYHSYDGDEVTVDGPSILARKSVGKSTSVYANYYADSVSSASIDVRTTASEYTEDRTEYSLGADFLVDNTTISAGYTNSDENDYTSNTYHVGISHNMFGDLTTVSLGVSYADDKVRRNVRDASGNVIGSDPNFDCVDVPDTKLERRNYRLGLTQIVTKDLVLNLGFEAVLDDGCTQNPYRTARIYTDVDQVINNVRIPGFTQENYPNTRTSDAFAIRANYFLPYRAAIHTELKYYTDSWGIEAKSFKIGYVHPYREQWTIDVAYRYYTQDQADFYQDVYEENETNLKYYGRDKELSKFYSHGLAFGVTYDFLQNGWWKFDKASASFSFERIDFQYDNFTDFDLESDNLGEQFEFSANVIQIYFSAWY